MLGDDGIEHPCEVVEDGPGKPKALVRQGRVIGGVFFQGAEKCGECDV